MKNKKGYIGLIVFPITVFVIVYIKFTNIDMTETRLFLEFWPIWVSIIIFWLLFGLKE